MNPALDLYAVLGLSLGASADDIRSAYRLAARRFHPDLNHNPGAASQFKDIAAAYEVLGDPIARDQYDNRRRQIVGSEKTYFSLRVTPSKRILPVLPEAQVLYILAELVPERPRSGQATEINLNLTLIIDRSTSMNGPRLERTRAAAFQIIEQLSEKDILSVVTFSDRADVVVPAGPVTDKAALKAQVAIMQANGGTEILQGLDAGLKENQRLASKKYLNHIILLTGGRTYGDETASLDLADRAAKNGIGISAMGIGEEWNDSFLDQLASPTGGPSQYISQPRDVVPFLNERLP